MLCTGDFSPGHRDLRFSLTTSTESQPAEIAQKLFGQALRQAKLTAFPLKEVLAIAATVLVLAGLYWVLAYFAFPNGTLAEWVLSRAPHIQYFPLVESLSRGELSPTYGADVTTDGIVRFPLLGLAVHALLFRFFDFAAFPIADVIFVLFTVAVLFFYLRSFRLGPPVALAVVVAAWGVSVLPPDLPVPVLNQGEHILGRLIGWRFPRPLVSGPAVIAAFAVLLAVFRRPQRLAGWRGRPLIWAACLGASGALVLQTGEFWGLLSWTCAALGLVAVAVYQRRLAAAHARGILASMGFFLAVASVFLLQLHFGSDALSDRLGVRHFEFGERLIILRDLLAAGPIWRDFVLLFVPLLAILSIAGRFAPHWLGQEDAIGLAVIGTSGFVAAILFPLLSPIQVQPFHMLRLPALGLALAWLPLVGLGLGFVLTRLASWVGRSWLVPSGAAAIVALSFVVLALERWTAASRASIRPGEFAPAERTAMRSDLRRLLPILEDAGEDGSPLLLTNDLHVMMLWKLKQLGHLQLADVFTITATHDAVEKRLIEAAQILGWSSADLLTWLRPGAENSENSGARIRFWLGHYYYQANGNFIFPRGHSVPRDVRDRVADLPAYSFKRVLTQEVEARLRERYAATSSTANVKPDLIVWLKDGRMPNREKLQGYTCEYGKMANYLICKR